VTRTGSAKAADKNFAQGRLTLARAYLKAAQDEAARAEEDSIGNPIISQIVHAAIGYADALTAKFAGRVNQQDHGGAVKILRDAFGQPPAEAPGEPPVPHPWRARRRPSTEPASRAGRMPSGCSPNSSTSPSGRKAS
jgi:hypothetical protein